MNEMQAFDTILSEILKRKRKPVPEVLLTGKSFDESIPKRTVRETNQFRFNEKDVEVGIFNPRYYTTELLYMKRFTKTIYISTTRKDYKPTWTRYTAIIKISDFDSKVFYMYIRVIFSDQIEPHSKELDYRIVYSTSFHDLVTFIYKPKDIPDFLNSEAFISQSDIIKTYQESFIKKLNMTRSMLQSYHH